MNKSEREIASLEAEMTAKQIEIENAQYDNSHDYQQLLKSYELLKNKLDEQMQIWENTAEELDSYS